MDHPPSAAPGTVVKADVMHVSVHFCVNLCSLCVCACALSVRRFGSRGASHCPPSPCHTHTHTHTLSRSLSLSLSLSLSVQLHIQTAGPFTTRGSYRMRVVLYDGFQPISAGPDLLVGASTSRRALSQEDDSGGLKVCVWGGGGRCACVPMFLEV